MEKVTVTVVEETETLRDTTYRKKRLLVNGKEVIDYNGNRVRKLAVEILGFKNQGELYERVGVSYGLADKLGWNPESKGFDWASTWSGFYRFLEFMGLGNSTLEEKVRLLIDIYNGKINLSPVKEKSTLYETEVEVPKRNIRRFEDYEEEEDNEDDYED